LNLDNFSEEVGFRESKILMAEKERALGYKTGSGFFCAKCFEKRTDRIEKIITEHDLKVFFFFCDDCGDKICKREKES
jgi:hypothetical protein